MYQPSKVTIFVGWLAPVNFTDTLGAPTWENAMTGNFDPTSGVQNGFAGPDAVSNVQASFSQFLTDLVTNNGNPYYNATLAAGDFSNDPTAANLSAQQLNDILGTWGVDTAGHDAWTVINHNSQFAVEPEPSTLALAALGLLGLAGYGVRRRRKK